MDTEHTARTREQYIELNLEAYAAIVQDYRAGRFLSDAAPAYVSLLALQAGDRGHTELELLYAAYAYHLRRGFTLGFIRTTIDLRLRGGATFRAALLWSYKGNRTRLPPC